MTGIFNFKEVDSQIAIGGQPMLNQFELLDRQGYQAIVQIRVQEADYVLQDEAYQVSQHNMEHGAMNMSFANPTLADVEKFFALMDKFKGKKVFAHCAAGFCTSGMIAMYKMKREGISFDDAKAQYALEQWQPNDSWLRLIEEVKQADL